MTARGPAKGTGVKVSVENAAAAWGSPPDWIVALAEACDAHGSSQAIVAQRIGYSKSAVSHVLKNNYPGDLSKIEQAVRGALLAETVNCPVVGEVRRNVCLEHQKRARHFNPTSGMRVQLYRACRKTCEHSSIRGSANVE